MLQDLTPGSPVWVKVTGKRRLMARVVETYHPGSGRRSFVLVRFAEDYGAYRRGAMAVFHHNFLLHRDVDRRKERSWGISEWLTRRLRRSAGRA